jgi:hypothetical protein
VVGGTAPGTPRRAGTTTAQSLAGISAQGRNSRKPVRRATPTMPGSLPGTPRFEKDPHVPPVQRQRMRQMTLPSKLRQVGDVEWRRIVFVFGTRFVWYFGISRAPTGLRARKHADCDSGDDSGNSEATTIVCYGLVTSKAHAPPQPVRISSQRRTVCQQLDENGIERGVLAIGKLLLGVVAAAIVLALMGGAVYLVVRFVHWAWNQ